MKSITDIFSAPSALFEQQKAAPGWITPFILVSVLGILTALLMQPAQASLMAAQLADKLPPEQVEKVLERAGSFSILAFATVPLMTLIRWALVGGILLMLSFLFTDRLSFKKSFSIVGWSSVILAVGALVNMGMVYLRGAADVTTTGDLARTGLNIFLSEASTGPGIYLFLASITPFALWYVILVGIGVKSVGEISLGKAYLLSFITWALGTGFAVGMGVMGKSFGMG